VPRINLGKKNKPPQSLNKDFYQHIYADRRWKSIRDWKRRDNPLCEKCEKEGRVRQMDHVHHIISFITGRNKDEIEELAYDKNNVMSVCEECHAELHAK